MRELNVNEMIVVAGGDDGASAVCESVGDIGSAVGGAVGAAVGAAATENPIGIVTAGAVGVEAGEAIGEGVCESIGDSFDETMNQVSSFLISAIHGPVVVDTDWY